MMTDDQTPTLQTVREFFNDKISRGQSTLPDSNTIGGYGTALKYASIAAALSKTTGKVLDIGCNRGSVEFLFEATYKPGTASKIFTVGIDISRLAVQQAHALELEHASFFPYDGNILPFRTNSFDLVVMVEVFEHIIDKRTTLLEVARVLKPGGRLILTTPNPACWALQIEQTVWGILRKIFKKEHPHKDIFIEVRDLLLLLRDVGFSSINTGNLYRWPRAFIHFCGWSIFPLMPPGWLLVYQKLWLSFLGHIRLPSFILNKLMWTIWVDAELVGNAGTDGKG